MFCESGKEQGGERASAQSSQSLIFTRTSALHGTILNSLLLNGHFCGNVSPLKTAAAAAPQAPTCWIKKSEERSGTGGDLWTWVRKLRRKQVVEKQPIARRKAKRWERKLSLFLLNCCLGWANNVLCACMWSEGFFDKERLMGEADEFLIKCLILVSRFIDFFLLLVDHLSRWSPAHFRCVILRWLLVYIM